MMTGRDMIILYAAEDVVVFQIGSNIYYLRDRTNLPELYDNQLRKQVTVNLDHWLQAQTQQRHSLQGLRDMAAAFRRGFQCNMSREQIRELLAEAIIETRKQIFLTDLAADFSRIYFIETVDPTKIETQYIPSIRNNFSRLIENCGEDELYNYLCRFWRSCTNHSLGSTGVFESLIHKLNRQPAEPKYPDTSTLDEALIQKVELAVSRSVTTNSIPDGILQNVSELQQRQ